ncbi:uncharacterized protein LOC120255489 [Dioscorea cayenensis subsp. rotundata]|uniref:Uncharacterized protein LOC120255489 n=1 Tax=Dioscorea cayennensis subsp. rotundata TaxID=55577 RepID=A0AB40AW78_DIOCR|nr:uncharacterized protein LOC120255489 [Dioscorea cayenensis subsp. rotundata]
MEIYIKPSKALLDANLFAQIADFGLARFKSSIGNELQHDEEDVVEKPATTETYEKAKTQGGMRMNGFPELEECQWGGESLFPAGLRPDGAGIPRNIPPTVGLDRLSVDSETQRSSQKRLGKVLSSNDYVVEWICSEIKKSTTS